jgi:hypothetical protein
VLIYYSTLPKALTIYTGKLGKDHASTARIVGIVKYLMKRYAEARINLGNFIRVVDSKRNFDMIEYAIAFLLFGKMSPKESGPEDARVAWENARHVFQRNPRIKELIPELDELISNRLPNVRSVQREQKKIVTKLASFEDRQMSRESPIEERIADAIRNYNFDDDYKCDLFNAVDPACKGCIKK